MANICTNYVTITGPDEDLKDLREKINKQNKTLVDDSVCGHLGTDQGYGLENSLPLDEDTGDSLELIISSKWSPPMDDFERLSELYPRLVINVRYDEPGNDVYGVLTFGGGECTGDSEMEAFDYLLEYVQEFREFVEEIQDSSYRTVRSKYIVGDDGYKDDPMWDTYWPLLVPLVMDRAKDHDLPILVLKPEFKELAQERLLNKTKNKLHQ